MGRRKIEMKMVKDSCSRQVTFSKRRTGLFKKANELATLCGAQIAIVAFSPGGKPFSFGNPTVHVVAQRFLNQETKPRSSVSSSSSAATLEKLNCQLTELQRQIQIEKKKELAIEEAMKEENIPKSFDEMSIAELLKMKKAMEELHGNIKARVGEMEASSSLLLLSKKPVQEK
ncbi:Agamous-like MADS-box protein AGL29 [Euphorbia peplus]|nr:Agamous-like MADS-box protein AGL29 [Euphorbia peplus]